MIHSKGFYRSIEKVLSGAGRVKQRERFAQRIAPALLDVLREPLGVTAVHLYERRKDGFAPAKTWGAKRPDVGVDLTYFVGPGGFAKETAWMPGDGPTWLVSLVALPDTTGRERLYAGYVKVKPPLTVYARGLAVFDDDKAQFDRVAEVDLAAPAFPIIPRALPADATSPSSARNKSNSSKP